MSQPLEFAGTEARAAPAGALYRGPRGLVTAVPYEGAPDWVVFDLETQELIYVPPDLFQTSYAPVGHGARSAPLSSDPNNESWALVNAGDDRTGPSHTERRRPDDEF